MATPSKDLSDTVYWFLYFAPMGTQTYRNNDNNNTQRPKTRYTLNSHNDSVTKYRNMAAMEEGGDRRPGGSTPALQHDEAWKVCI